MVTNPAGSFGHAEPVGRLTVTVTPVEDFVLPAASRATAVSVWVPVDVAEVSQVIAYGDVASSAPRFTPSSLNCTPTTPRLSLALADTVVAPETVAPFAGAVIATDGAVVSGEGGVRQPI